MAVVEGVPKAVWRMLAPAYFKGGFSFRGAMVELRALGYSLRTSTALTMWRSASGLIKGEYAARTVDPAKRYSQNKMVETDLHAAYKYRVHGQATYTNIATGDVVTKRVSMFSNSWLSQEGWGKQFGSWKDKMEYETGWSLTNIDFKVAEHNAGFSY